MTHRGPFQPLLFCDSVIIDLIPRSRRCLENSVLGRRGKGVCAFGVVGVAAGFRKVSFQRIIKNGKKHQKLPRNVERERKKRSRQSGKTKPGLFC